MYSSTDAFPNKTNINTHTLFLTSENYDLRLLFKLTDCGLFTML